MCEASKCDPASFIGKHIVKNFVNAMGYNQQYTGRVLSHDSETDFFKMEYDDRDCEELELHEMAPRLVKRPPPKTLSTWL